MPWQRWCCPISNGTTSKGKWWLGRKLKLRIHLGALLLQWLYDLSDRQVEWAMKDNAAYQLFCGCGIVENWYAPDHTKIEEFRSRLSPETQRQIANQVAVWATELGFADPSKMDIDATIQEANIAYPSDAHLMVKMTLAGEQGLDVHEEERVILCRLYTHGGCQSCESKSESLLV